MGVLSRLLPRRRQNPKQILSDELVNQTQDLLESLIKLRKTRDLTQADVAERIGVSRTAVTHFERYDADPKISTIIRYALAVGGRIEIDVSDGLRWAEDSLVMERLSEYARGPAEDAQPSPSDSFKAAVHHALADAAHA